MGSVWRATHLVLGSEVAVKLINPTVADNPEVQERFLREAKAAAGLSSPHVVQVMDYGVDGDTPYIVMELLHGESLKQRLDDTGKLSLEDTARVITEVGRALTKAHDAGIVHRDLKPDNIFLVRNDDTEIAKVLDFGVAKETTGVESAHMTSTGAVMGTPFYMSPEQAEGAKGVDQRTDIWALAVIAYECILGERPFGSESLAGLFLDICTRPMPVPSYRGPVPPGFDEWFEKATAREIHERFVTVKEAVAGLRDICLPDRESALPPLVAQTIGGVTTLHLRTPDDTRLAAPELPHPQFATTLSARPQPDDSITLASHSHAQPKSRAKSRWPLVVLGAVVAVSALVMVLRSGDSSGNASEPNTNSIAVDSAAEEATSASRTDQSAPASERAATTEGPSPAESESMAAVTPSRQESNPPVDGGASQRASIRAPARSTPARAPASNAHPPGQTSSAPSSPGRPSPAQPSPAPEEKPRFDLGI
jgi:serine/threonine-protein kinase